jgi:DNA-binding NtrC family response regulator
MRKRLLIVDNDDTTRRLCKKIFCGELYETFIACDAEEVFRLLERVPIDLVLLNQQLPDRSGLEVLEEIKSANMDIAVVMISGRGSIEQAVQSMKLGADDFVEKPFLDLETLKDTVDGVLTKREKQGVSSKTEKSDKIKEIQGKLIGQCEPMRKLKNLIKKVAPLDSTVLVIGETGTGKEVVAQMIHALSTRVRTNFVPVHCGGIPETLLESSLFGHEKGAFTGAYRTRKGYFEVADKGTIFLDEIGDTTPSFQVKLLRVLQDKQFRRVGGIETLNTDARIIAATNHDLEREVEKERFRQDLYYRLNVITIQVPPLRDRIEDIPLLANYFLELYAKKHGKDEIQLAEETSNILYRCPWKGNVRELENVIERAVALSDRQKILPSDLPQNIQDKSSVNISTSFFYSFAKAKDVFEKQYVMHLLRRAGGNVSQAARLAGMPRQNLHLKIKKHGLKTSEILNKMSLKNDIKSLFNDNAELPAS